MFGNPAVVPDDSTHLYTLVIKADNTIEMYVDEEILKEGSLFTDMYPVINPPQMIPDPDEVKPEDWIDLEYMEDPDASKPDDWDESLPSMIPNLDATKPDGWLDNEPLEVPDPESIKPSEWDDEEDGEFEPQMISNPKCQEIGCGEWTQPLMKNPVYVTPQ